MKMIPINKYFRGHVNPPKEIVCAWMNSYLNLLTTASLLFVVLSISSKQVTFYCEPIQWIKPTWWIGGSPSNSVVTYLMHKEAEKTPTLWATGIANTEWVSVWGKVLETVGWIHECLFIFLLFFEKSKGCSKAIHLWTSWCIFSI